MSKPLTAAQLQELKTLLEQRKAEIEGRLHEVRDGQTRAEHAREIIQRYLRIAEGGLIPAR